MLQVDCNKKQKICQKFNVQKFPEIKLFVDKTIYDYNGDRSYDKLLAFVNSRVSLN